MPVGVGASGGGAVGPATVPESVPRTGCSPVTVSPARRLDHFREPVGATAKMPRPARSWTTRSRRLEKTRADVPDGLCQRERTGQQTGLEIGRGSVGVRLGEHCEDTRDGLAVRAKTAGPSNIGNLLAGEGVPATAGFGVPYEGLHAIDERAHLAELPQVYIVYQRAVLGLLGG